MLALLMVSFAYSEGTQCALPVCKSSTNCPNPATENPFLFNSVCLHDGTEFPGTGALLNDHTDGLFRCACCGSPLFDSHTKFESGTGWPSFYDALGVTTSTDYSLGDTRTAVSCATCGAHLGHVFTDGPPPTGLRYCINSVCLQKTPLADNASVGAHALQTAPPLPKPAPAPRKAVFAGGCFWGLEMIFESVIGVQQVLSGYAGGSAQDAHYEIVSLGKTGHAESVQITFDPSAVTYAQLLDVFFHIHDPTTLNRQMPDVGRQYRSAIFFTSKAQQNQALSAKTRFQSQFARPIVTEIVPLVQFFPAEEYHQDFARKNPQQAYIVRWDDPKFQAFKRAFPALVKPGV